MKKHLIVVFLLIYVVLGSIIIANFNMLKTTNTSIVQYGKIVENSLLKKSPTKVSNLVNSYFILEKSYFVKILNEENDFYYVEYLDIKGYIEKSYINLVNEEISKPYLDSVTFDIIKESALYEEPINSNNAIKSTLNKQSKVFYYGKLYGDCLEENGGNTWYYCKIKQNDKEVNGYIYASYTNNLSPIKLNEEISTSLINKDIANEILNLNIKTQIIITTIISIPIIFLVIILLKGFKKI